MRRSTHGAARRGGATSIASPIAALLWRWNAIVPGTSSARLDDQAMHEAAQTLIGKHDFSTFRDSQCQAKSPVRTLDLFAVERVGEEIAFHVEALSFLHRQVRSMVGSLVEVGLGRWRVANMQEALAAADRRRCGPVAPACGLYLEAVRYGEEMAEDGA